MNIKKISWSTNTILLLLILLLCVTLSILSPHQFLSLRNFQSMAFQLPEFGLFSIAMAIVIFTGGINLSLVFASTFSMIVGGITMSTMYSNDVSPVFSIFVGILVTLLLGVLLGSINGYIIAYLEVSAILTTLGTMILFEGLSLFITKGGAISNFPPQFDFIGNKTIIGIPFPMIIFILMAFVIQFLIEKTNFGQQIFAIGSNQNVAKYSGVSVSKNILLIYILSALIGSIVAIIMASRYNSIKESYGYSYLLQSVAAAALGGANIYGGEGSIKGTVLAVILIQIVSNGFNIVGINRYFTSAFIGCILVFVIIVNSLKVKIRGFTSP